MEKVTLTLEEIYIVGQRTALKRTQLVLSKYFVFPCFRILAGSCCAQEEKF